MYPYVSSPKPLSHQAFYALLVLARTELHAYAVRDAIINDSLGSVRLSTGRLYALIQDLHEQGFIELTGQQSTNASGILRRHYQTSELGLIRLQEEFTRLNHAVEIGQSHQLCNDEATELRRLRLSLGSDYT